MAVVNTLIGNIKGPQGDTGATGQTGPQGEAATINVGTVSTTAYGNPAQVVNIGTENEAILNFTIMCLTIQKATGIDDQKQMKAFIQGSYNGRLLLQAGWIVAAFLIPHTNVVAAAAPLLFPNLTIFYLQYKGKLVEPSERKNPPAEEQEEPDEEALFARRCLFEPWGDDGNEEVEANQRVDEP